MALFSALCVVILHFKILHNSHLKKKLCVSIVVLPVQVFVDHLDHSVLNVLLFRGEALVHLLLVLLGQVLDDQVAVGDLLAVQLHEGQEAPLASQLSIVINVLQRELENIQ